MESFKRGPGDESPIIAINFCAPFSSRVSHRRVLMAYGFPTGHRTPRDPSPINPSGVPIRVCRPIVPYCNGRASRRFADLWGSQTLLDIHRVSNLHMTIYSFIHVDEFKCDACTRVVPYSYLSYSVDSHYGCDFSWGGASRARGYRESVVTFPRVFRPVRLFE